MTTSTVTIVGDVSDLIGNDYDPSRTKVWVQHNTDKVVTDSGPIRLGAATQNVGSDGTFSFANVVASTSLVTNLQATLWVDWPNTAGPERTRRQVSFGPYDLTGLSGTVDIRTLEATQALDPVASSALLSEMQDLRDQVQDISQIAVPDDVITAIDANPASDFRQQQDARQSASYMSTGTTSVDVAAYGNNLNAALTANPGDGIRFLLSQPVYTLTTTAVLGAACTLEGVGPAVSKITIANGVNGPVVRGKNFAALTGKTYAAGDINVGAAQAELRRVVIDGNKTNQSTGWGLQLWGRSMKMQDVIVTNCKSGGIYTEFTTHPDGSLPSLLEGFFDNIKVQGNDGDGWRFRGPHDSVIQNFITTSNAGWGFKSESAASGYTGGIKGSHWNSWLNSNSFYFGGAVDLTHADATGTTGTGIELVAGGGGARLTGMIVSGHPLGVLLRGTDLVFNGIIQAATTAGVQVGSTGAGNEAGRILLDIVGSNFGKVLDLVNVSGPGSYRARVTSATTLINGFGSGADFFDMWSNTESRFGLPGTGFSAAGWNPKYPGSNGTLRTDDTVPILATGAQQNLAPGATAADIRTALIALGLCK